MYCSTSSQQSSFVTSSKQFSQRLFRRHISRCFVISSWNSLGSFARPAARTHSRLEVNAGRSMRAPRYHAVITSWRRASLLARPSPSAPDQNVLQNRNDRQTDWKDHLASLSKGVSSDFFRFFAKRTSPPTEESTVRQKMTLRQVSGAQHIVEQLTKWRCSTISCRAFSHLERKMQAVGRPTKVWVNLCFFCSSCVQYWSLRPR